MIPEDKRAPTIDLKDSDIEAIRTLGLLYFPGIDCHSFRYEVPFPEAPS